MKPRHGATGDAIRKARELTRRLGPLAPRAVRAEELPRITGGRESASTSTSGTPAAGDDTTADYTWSMNNLKQIGLGG